MKVTIIDADDWQGIFLGGYLHDQGHQLGEGNHFYYLLNLSDKYDFDSDDIKNYYVNRKGEIYLDTYGSFPNELESFEGLYD